QGGDTAALVTGFDAAYHFIDEHDGRLCFHTTKDAPLGRIISIDPRNGSDVREIVAEAEDRLSSAVMTRDGIVAAYLHNASDRLRHFALDGSRQGEVPLPGIGSLVTLDAAPDGEEIAFVFTGFTTPPGGWISR